MTYDAPILSVLVLDYLKPEVTRVCLESIKSHVKVPCEVVYLHNGQADYPYQFFKDGLVDRFIQTKANGGLGLGTRDLFAAAAAPYCLYLQNDQQLIRDIDDQTFRYLVGSFGLHPQHAKWPAATVKSISLAGPVGGMNVYSERLHLIETSFYRSLEGTVLGYGGAGPYHSKEWRERQMQDYYRAHQFVHLTDLPPFVQDNGFDAVRLNPDGSRWRHRTDSKELWLEAGPVKEAHVYPNLTDDEWKGVLDAQTWTPGVIPIRDKPHSFKVWN